MKVMVNKKLLVLDNKITLENLLIELSVSTKYMAIEVNEMIIP